MSREEVIKELDPVVDRAMKESAQDDSDRGIWILLFLMRNIIAAEEEHRANHMLRPFVVTATDAFRDAIANLPQ